MLSGRLGRGRAMVGVGGVTDAGWQKGGKRAVVGVRSVTDAGWQRGEGGRAVVGVGRWAVLVCHVAAKRAR